MPPTNNSGDNAGKFRRLFKREVHKLKPEENCSTKRHFKGVLYQVAGALEYLACLDKTGERFVYPQVSAIQKMSTNPKTGKPYALRAVKYALAEFRRLRAISDLLYRERGDTLIRGFIVAPHDALCVRRKSRCVFEGQLRAPGRWESDCAGNVWYAGPPQTVHPTVHPKTPDNAPNSALDNENSALNSALQNENSCTQQCTQQCTPETAQTSENNSDAGGIPKNPAVIPAATGASYPMNLVSQPINPPTATESTNEKNCTETAKQETASSSSLTDQNRWASKNPETIGQHFGTGVSIEIISDKEIEKSEVRFFTAREWANLEKCCVEVVEEMAAQPYLGRKVNGDLMAKAMALFKKKHGKQVPDCWYAVAKKLRKVGGPSVFGVTESYQQPETSASEWRGFPVAQENWITGLGKCIEHLSQNYELKAFEKLITEAVGNAQPESYQDALPIFEAALAATPGDIAGPLRTACESIKEALASVKP